jgi:glycosyltransferase involved in cell wall biosynthesis
VKYILTIPIFNEEKNIKNLINSLKKSFLIDDNDCTRILLINDGSADKTKEKIKLEIKNNAKIILINHKINKGYGAALKTGIKYSKIRSEYIIFIDSDLTNPIKDIRKIKKFMNLNIDFIQGDRVSAGLDLLPISRSFFTFFGNKVAKFFMNMNINDYTGGYRAVKLSLYKNVILKENDFSIIMEEKYKLKDKIFSIAQFKTKIHVRSKNLRETTFNYSIPLICKYLKYALKAAFVKKKF